MAIIIRKANQMDVCQIEKVDTFKEILNKGSPLDRLDNKYQTKKGERNYYEKFICGKNKWCYVVGEKNKILGFILFKVEKRELFWKIKTIGYIELIVIDKAARGKGLSRLLFQKAFDIFREKDLSYVKLSVQSNNNFALRIWNKFGFREYRHDLYKRI